MKRPWIALLLILAGALASLPAIAETASVGTKDLIEKPRDFDGKTIVFLGEAIGDAMRRGDHAWVNLLDANAAMGIWLPAADSDAIKDWGSYQAKGDVVRIRGVFHRACPEHGGDMDIHAESLEIIARGKASAHPVNQVRLVLMPLSLALASALFLAWKRREKSGKAATEAWNHWEGRRERR